MAAPLTGRVADGLQDIGNQIMQVQIPQKLPVMLETPIQISEGVPNM